MVSMAALPYFPQNQSALFKDNGLCKYWQEVSKNMTEGRCKISSTIKKTGFGKLSSVESN